MLANEYKEPERSLISLASEPALRPAFEFVAHGTWPLNVPKSFLKMVKQDRKNKIKTHNENRKFTPNVDDIYKEHLKVKIVGIWHTTDEDFFNKHMNENQPSQTQMFENLKIDDVHNVDKYIYR